MGYTMWENTPLKWHKFLTFFLLPLGAILNVCQAILAISDIQNWTGILIPVNIIDLIRFIACAILGITAIYGCLPSRRRWYGPKCAIILYAVLSVYSIYNIIAAYLLSVANSEFVSQSIANLISFSLTSGLMYIYYKKRRLLFSNSNISAQQRHVKQGTEITTESQYSKSEPENSVELLMEIQNDSPQKQNSDKQFKQEYRNKKTVPLWGAVVLGIACIILSVSCFGIWFNMSNDVKSWEDNYHHARAEKDMYKEKYDSIKYEIVFWQDHAVIVTEYGEKYHTYGCQYIKGRDFWIYNVEAAIGMGYTPCSVCNPPRP
nr:MAG TPA: DNA methyl phosphotriester repair domain protein [Caudoviricetes sp.]